MAKGTDAGKYPMGLEESQFTNNNTNVDVSFVINDGELDLAIITTTALSDPALRKAILYSFNEIPIAGNAFRDKLSGRSVPLSELVNYPLITLSRDTESFAYHDQLFAKNGVILTPYIETHTMRQALAFAESDMGITCLAEEYVQPFIDEGTIFRIQINEGLPEREISLIKNTNSRTRAAMELEKQILRFNRNPDENADE